jgi:hypothetical protein
MEEISVVRILVADDSRAIRRCLRGLLDHREDWLVCGFTVPLPFEAYQSRLNLGIWFGQGDAMLESRRSSPATPLRGVTASL